METQQNQQQNLSEIAQFLERWDKEMEALQQALKEFAITARHDFINRRIQALGDDRIIELMILEAKRAAQNRDRASDMAKNHPSARDTRKRSEKWIGDESTPITDQKEY